MTQMHKRIIFPLLALSLFLFIWNLLAIKLYLYWTTEWVDAISHFIGGTIVSLALFVAFGALLKRKHFVFRTLLFTLLIGALWEVFELVSHMVSLYEAGYLTDTFTDLILDTLGAFIGARYIKKHE